VVAGDDDGVVLRHHRLVECNPLRGLFVEWQSADALDFGVHGRFGEECVVAAALTAERFREPGTAGWPVRATTVDAKVDGCVRGRDSVHQERSHPRSAPVSS
jgi:hypothetical protein